MQILRVRNVHEALPQAITFMESGVGLGLAVQRESRAGMVIQSLLPVTTMYEQPRERVLFHPERDANPFFHFMEGLWMLGGRKDTGWIGQFNKSFVQFSDNGAEFHGAYGHRWRNHFTRVEDTEDGVRLLPIDQLRICGQLLKKNPEDRRAVMAMWDPAVDLGEEGKDFPCNTNVYFNVNQGHLDMMVSCRSNDIVWGAYGANAVHMSMMQEVVAAEAGVPVGIYYQMSFNYHAYLDTLEKVKGIEVGTNPYENNEINPYPMVNISNMDTWYEDLKVFLEQGPITGFRDPFFRRVVNPIYQAWMAKSNKDDPDRWEHAFEIIDQCSAVDWKIACMEWMERRSNG